jgi:hypothetical protein
MNALLSMILGDKDLPASFKDGVRIGVSHKLSPESRQMLDDDHFEDMVKEAREREQMEGDE